MTYYNPQGISLSISSVMKRVYLKMTAALVVSALAAWMCLSTGIYKTIFSSQWMMIGLIVVELGLVIGITGALRKLSTGAASALFYLFAIVNGLTLAPIFMVYTDTQIIKTFLITAGVFGAMSIYGYLTTRDLTKIGTYLIMGLFGLIILSVINIFTQSSQTEWVISLLGVMLFIGLTAWDTQQIKNMAMMAPSTSVGKLATMGALSLYLDFINLFLMLLRFFGNDR